MRFVPASASAFSSLSITSETAAAPQGAAAVLRYAARRPRRARRTGARNMPSPLQTGEIIRSRTHPAIRRIQALQSRGERDRSGLFYTEGVRFVAQAIEQRARVEALLVAPELLVNPFARKLVRRQEHRGVRCLQ